jgi:hypothetical protein
MLSIELFISCALAGYGATYQVIDVDRTCTLPSLCSLYTLQSVSYVRLWISAVPCSHMSLVA